MKKLLLISTILLISLSFAWEFKQVNIGKSSTKDTVLAAAACTTGATQALNGMSRCIFSYWTDTIGSSGSNWKITAQVSPDASHWLNFDAPAAGDSITGEDCALKIDTVRYNNVTYGSPIGCFKFVRFIYAGVYSNQKSIINAYISGYK